MEPRFVLYSGDTVPRLLRPPVEGEVHLWTKSDGSRYIYSDESGWVALPSQE